MLYFNVDGLFQTAGFSVVVAYTVCLCVLGASSKNISLGLILIQ